MRTPNLEPGGQKSQTHDGHLKWETVSWDWALNQGVWTNPSVRSKLNCGTPPN